MADERLPLTPDELHALIEARYDAWLAERRLHPELGVIDWAGAKPSPGQTFSAEVRTDLHLFMGPSYS